MRLSKTQKNQTYGHTINGQPEYHIYDDALYVPKFSNYDPRLGIYDKSGTLILQAAIFGGNPPALKGQSIVTTYDIAENYTVVDEAIYLGHADLHYGHTITEFVPRLWVLDQIGYTSQKLLIHSIFDVVTVISCKWFIEFLNLFKINVENIVIPSSLTKIKKLIVPSPSFGENSFVFSDFNRFCVQARMGIIPNKLFRNRKIFLAKSKMRTGLVHVSNESALCWELEKCGFVIIFPETLSVAEQISIFSSDNIVCGLIGSAFHTLAFVKNARVIILSYDDPNNNFLLIDHFSNNMTKYYIYEHREIEKKEGFSRSMEIVNVNKVVYELDTLAQKVFDVVQNGTMSYPVHVERKNFEIEQASNNKTANSKLTCAIVVCARWEGKYIREWVFYYRAIGFNRIYLYCNDDRPDELYEQVKEFTEGAAPFIIFRHHVGQGQQREMYITHLDEFGGNEDWFGFLDVDEFLRLPNGMKIGEFLSQFSNNIGAVLFNWVFFGPNGHKSPPDAPVLASFTRRQKDLHPNTKFLIRSAAMTSSFDRIHTGAQPFWHRPNPLLSDDYRIVNAVGDDARHYYDQFPDGCAKFINDGARLDALLSAAVIHHYAFRSEQAFAERAARGTLGSFAGQEMWKNLSEGEGFAAFLASVNEVPDVTLADFWKSHPIELVAGNAVDHAPTPALIPLLLSLNRPATQSSLSPWSRGATLAADAGGGVDGTIDGRPGFHTALDDRPWWQVDLEALARITEIRIYNRLDQPEAARRAARLAIEIGASPEELVEVFRRDEPKPFGGIDGAPLIFQPSPPISGRFVRVRLLDQNFLHLDQVEIYGEPHSSHDNATGNDSVTPLPLELSDREVLGRFQSVGNNCEFGSVQKSLGIGKLSLLQWSTSSPAKIVHAMRARFESYGQPEQTEVIEQHGEYFSCDRKYGFENHSFISSKSMSADDFAKINSKRSKFLTGKFLEDLADGGHIFVYNFFGESLPTMDVLKEMATEFSAHADNYLFAIGAPGPYCRDENKVFHFEKGLILATKDAYTTFNSTPPAYRPGWIEICRQALALIREHTPQFWDSQERRIDRDAASIASSPASTGNLCLGKSATQSSLSVFSIGRTIAEDAAGAIDGHINGHMKFHTDLEDCPWWQVDLGAIFGISEVRIFNRMDVPGIMARASRLAIEIGLEADHLVEIYRRETDEPFGGLGGDGLPGTAMAGPLVFAPGIPVPGRFVRVRLLARTFLHLDQVEVYGAAFPVPSYRLL